MISAYLDKALSRARYEVLDDGSFCATVPGLRGVLAVGDGVEECRRQLSEIVEEWILVRVARGLDVPKLGGISIKVRRAS